MTDHAPNNLSHISFRELCAELLAALEVEAYAHWVIDPEDHPLCERAYAALAAPPPEPPTDEELEKLADHSMVMDGATGSMFFEHLHFARAVLERWGNQATITQLHND